MADLNDGEGEWITIPTIDQRKASGGTRYSNALGVEKKLAAKKGWSTTRRIMETMRICRNDSGHPSAPWPRPTKWSQAFGTRAS